MNKSMLLRGRFLRYRSMANYCSFRTGGLVKTIYLPADSDDLRTFFNQLSIKEPLLWVGLGSNLLVRDGGFNGTVILTKGCLQSLTLGEKSLYAEAGVTCSKVARITARAGFIGLEFLAGIPGTIGGALTMNAGAFGEEIWQYVKKVKTIDRNGVIRERLPNEFKVTYREVKTYTDEWFLAAYFKLRYGNVKDAQNRIRTLLKKRLSTQPITLPSCGSTFKNPPGDYAARLIELSGFKGICIGGACISKKHVNFILNTCAATVSDIEELIVMIRERVARESGIRLQTEVHIVGEAI